MKRPPKLKIIIIIENETRKPPTKEAIIKTTLVESAEDIKTAKNVTYETIGFKSIMCTVKQTKL